MYYAHWGLSHSPFAGGAKPLFYNGETQAEALARLRYAAEERRHALLMGERGAGKSLLLRQYTEQRRHRGHGIVRVTLAGISPRELLWQVSAGFSLAPRPDEELAGLFRRLADFAQAAGSPCSSVLVLDAADQAGPDVRTCLVRLLSLGGSSRWLTAAVACLPKNVGRLGEELLETIDLRIELDPWSEPDTVGYIQHALVAAGGDRPVFEDEALSALYSLTDGVPRKVNRLADHAMLGAAAEGKEMVDAAMIEAAHDALSWAVAATTDR